MVRGGLPGKVTSDPRLERHKGGSCRNTGEERPFVSGNEQEVVEWREEGKEVDSLEETMGTDL